MQTTGYNLSQALEEFQEMKTLHCVLFVIKWFHFRHSICAYLNVGTFVQDCMKTKVELRH